MRRRPVRFDLTSLGDYAASAAGVWLEFVTAQFHGGSICKLWVLVCPATTRSSTSVSQGRWCTWPVQAVVGCSSLFGSSTPMPHKHNADRRHHIPKMSFKVQNWPAYEAGLRRRGSLTLWIEDAALGCWQTSGPSGQARFKDAAIQTSLMLHTAFKLPLRQTEGLMTSVLTLVGLTLSAPDHTTVSRRAVALRVTQPASVPPGPLHVLIDSTGLQVYGAGQWLEAKHGMKSRRTWRKRHLAGRCRQRHDRGTDPDRSGHG